MLLLPRPHNPAGDFKQPPVNVLNVAKAIPAARLVPDPVLGVIPFFFDDFVGIKIPLDLAKDDVTLSED